MNYIAKEVMTFFVASTNFSALNDYFPLHHTGSHCASRQRMEGGCWLTCETWLISPSPHCSWLPWVPVSLEKKLKRETWDVTTGPKCIYLTVLALHCKGVNATFNHDLPRRPESLFRDMPTMYRMLSVENRHQNKCVIILREGDSDLHSGTVHQQQQVASVLTTCYR